MARPHKQTVDYFPHDTDASEGKTLTIIQSKYGNDGFIWCQKFVDRLEDAYNRTTNGVPQRPKVRESLRQIAEKVGCSQSYLSQVTTGKRPPSEKLLKKCLSLGIDIKGVNVEIGKVSVLKSGQSANRNSENATEIPQTKLKETKLKETKLKETKLKETKLKESSSSSSHTGEEDQVNNLSEDMAEIATLYEVEIDRITSVVAEELKDALKEYSAEQIKDAIKEAVRQNKRKWSYVKGILRKWKEREGTVTKDDPDKFIRGKYGHMVQR